MFPGDVSKINVSGEEDELSESIIVTNLSVFDNFGIKVIKMPNYKFLVHCAVLHNASCKHSRNLASLMMHYWQ